MRRIRVAVCLLFVAACIVFGLYTIKVKMVEDHTPPVITCEEDEISVSVAAEDSELLEGLKAKDNKDGNLTKSIRVSSMSHFIEKGKRTISYVVFDKANQAATVQRTLIYTDYTSPKIHLKKPLRYTYKESDSVSLTENMTAEDCLDGDLTKQIYTTWGDGGYAYESGTYPITLQVNNSAGDVCVVPVEVTVIDESDGTEENKYYPMLSEYIAYTTVGNAIDPYAYLTGIEHRGAEYLFGGAAEQVGVTSDKIAVTSSVDYATPGVYPVEYSYTSSSGVVASTKLFVVVEE